MMIQAANIKGSPYCGPTTLSAIMGVDTQKAEQLYLDFRQSRYGRKVTTRKVKTTYTTETVEILKNNGFYSHPIKIDNTNFRLRYLVEKHPGKMLLITVPGHILVAQDDKIVCTQFFGKVGELKKSKYLHDKVVKAFMVTKW